MNDTCRAGEKLSVGKQELYTAYEKWIKDAGEPYALSRHDFRDALIRRGINEKRTKKGNIWLGLALVEFVHPSQVQHSEIWEDAQPLSDPCPDSESPETSPERGQSSND